MHTARASKEAPESAREMEPDMFRPDDSTSPPRLKFRLVTAAFLPVFEGATKAPQLKSSSSAMDNKIVMLLLDLGLRKSLGCSSERPSRLVPNF